MMQEILDVFMLSETKLHVDHVGHLPVQKFYPIDSVLLAKMLFSHLRIWLLVIELTLVAMEEILPQNSNILKTKVLSQILVSLTLLEMAQNQLVLHLVKMGQLTQSSNVLLVQQLLQVEQEVHLLYNLRSLLMDQLRQDSTFTLIL